MGEKANPWCHWPNSAWQFSSQNSVSNLQLPDIDLANRNSMVLPPCLNAHECVSSGNAATAAFFVRPLADEFVHSTSRLVVSPLPRSGLVVSPLPRSALFGIDVPQKRFLVFNRNGHHTCPILNAHVSNKRTMYSVAQLQGSNETNVTDEVHVNGNDMHEDTEEIEALLDSYSDEGQEEAQEEASTGQSPAESIASGGEIMDFARPAKKRRLSCDHEMSLIDTASSARAEQDLEGLHGGDQDAESCCIGKADSERTQFKENEQEADSTDDRTQRRERIQETVDVLRKIVPDGIGKDAVTVLDEAICYLKYLKLKAKTLGAFSL